MQLAEPQLVDAPGFEHVEALPLHVPPQSPVPAQGGCPSAGAPVTKLQVPTLLVRAHDWHAPVQGKSQHTPSLQLFEEQVDPVEHAVPLGESPGPTSASGAASGLASGTDGVSGATRTSGGVSVPPSATSRRATSGTIRTSILSTSTGRSGGVARSSVRSG